MMFLHNHTKFITLIFHTEIMRLYPVLPPHPKLSRLRTAPKLSFLDWCMEQFHDAVISRGLSNAVPAYIRLSLTYHILYDIGKRPKKLLKFYASSSKSLIKMIIFVTKRMVGISISNFFFLFLQ